MCSMTRGSFYILNSQTREVRIWRKVDQIGPKWDKSRTFSNQISVHLDKSGTFSDQISVHLARQRQMHLKSDLKKPRICPIWGQSDSNCCHLDTPATW